MRVLILSLLLAVAVLLPGCVASDGPLTLAPVGPMPMSPILARTNGWLVVHSAFETIGRFSGADPEKQQHTDYKIFAPDGKLWRAVHNDTGSMLEGPVAVDMPPGNYRVVARANGYGMVTVPVIIVTGKTTTVHLEGGYQWPARATPRRATPVRLPNGNIVGWQGDAAATR